MHYFNVHTENLQRAAEFSPLTYNSKRRSIFDDYTTEMVKKRSAFRDVKRVLHSCPGLRFGIFFPTVLRIITADEVLHEFTEPSATQIFVCKNVRFTETVDNDS